MKANILGTTSKNIQNIRRIKYFELVERRLKNGTKSSNTWI